MPTSSRRHALTLALAGLTGLSGQAGAQGQILRVGPDHAVRTLAEAARLARDGMRIEVDAGDYRADVAVWPQHDLSLRAVGGRVRLLADGAAAQRKGIFVTRGERLSIEGFDFIGAQVPDRNGAGIRHEAGSLSLRDCVFADNENGILTSNEASVRLRIEDCEFGRIRRHDGQNHNLYVGAIASLHVRGSYFHDGALGHLLKSRAAFNEISYNRLTDEAGSASYELEFPSGGLAIVLGNLIQQSAQTDNNCIVSYGAEGLRHARNELHLAHNTLIDQRSGAGSIYLRAVAATTRVRMLNNLLLGVSRFQPEAAWEARNNLSVDWDAFAPGARESLLPHPGPGLRGRLVDAGLGPDGRPLSPEREYRHPRGSVVLRGPAQYPGALQSG